MMKIRSNVKLMLVVLMALCSYSTYSQLDIQADKLSEKWIFLTEMDGVQVFISKQECQMGNVEEPFDYACIKLVNTTENTRVVNYSYHLNYTDGCVGCDSSDEYQQITELKGGETLEGDCSFKNSALVILLKNPLQTSYTDLVSLEIVDFKVD